METFVGAHGRRGRPLPRPTPRPKWLFAELPASGARIAHLPTAWGAARRPLTARPGRSHQTARPRGQPSFAAGSPSAPRPRVRPAACPPPAPRSPGPDPRSPGPGPRAPAPASPQYLVWARAQCGRRGEDAARRRRRRCVSLAPSRPAPAYLTAAAPRGHATWADSSAAPPRPMSVGAAPGTARRRRWGDGGTLSGARPGRRGASTSVRPQAHGAPTPASSAAPSPGYAGPTCARRAGGTGRDGWGVGVSHGAPLGVRRTPGDARTCPRPGARTRLGAWLAPRSRPIGGRGRARRTNGGALVGVARR